MVSDHRIKNSFEKSKAYKAAVSLIDLLNQEGFEAYIAGGAVRDALLGLSINDFDLATSASPEEMMRVFNDYKTLQHGIEYGTLTVVVDDEAFEITSYRGESDYVDGRRPSHVNFHRSKDEDLKRRDFTINAMFYHPFEGLYDPFNGERDLEDKVIKTVGDPVERFNEDALRIIRMMRFSVSLGFKVEEKTLKASKSLISLIRNLSKERVFSELEKVLSKKINEKEFEFLQTYYLLSKVELIDLSSEMNALKKAYVLSKFEPLIFDLSKYVLPKQLKKDFEFFVKLKPLSDFDLKKEFVKRVEKDKMSRSEALGFYEMILDSLSDGKAEAFNKGFRAENLSENLFKEIDEDLRGVKERFSGALIGEKLMELKVKHLWG